MIFVDRRQGSKDLVKAWPGAQLSELAFADVAIMGRGPHGGCTTIGIELKTVAELMGDVVAKRFLAYQLPGMRRTYDHNWLIVEGKCKQGAKGELLVPRTLGWTPLTLGRKVFTWQTYQALLLTITHKGGVAVACTSTRGQTLDACKQIAAWWQRGWEAHHALEGFYAKPSGEVIPRAHSLLRLWLKDLSGIGWARSAEAEQHFASAYDMATADPARFAMVKGVSAKGAEAIVKAIRQRRDGSADVGGASQNADGS